MESTILGRTGLRVSAAGLGCGGHSRLGLFTKGMENACAVVRCAYENGVNFFDTAYAYGTQGAVGRALRGLPRESYVLSTKFPYRGENGILPAAALEENVDACLRELGAEVLDIYHLHGVRPEDYGQARDRFAPELERMKRKGKIRFAGITELFGGDTSHRMLRRALDDDCWDVMMVGYNLLNPSAARTVLPAAKAKGIGILCMFAVRSALSDPAMLRPDIRRMLELGQADPALVKEEGALDFLTAGGGAASLPEAAYRFCRYTPGVDVTLIGTGSAEHLREDLRAVGKPPLPAPALRRLGEMFGRVDCVSGQQSFPEPRTPEKRGRR